MAETPLPKDDPRVTGFDAFRASEEYPNVRRWALHEEHVDGSLWRAYIEGFTAAFSVGRITSVSLRAEGDEAVVEVTFADRPGVYVEIIREWAPGPDGEPPAFSHAVLEAGLAAAWRRSREDDTHV